MKSGYDKRRSLSGSRRLHQQDQRLLFSYVERTIGGGQQIGFDDHKDEDHQVENGRGEQSFSTAAAECDAFWNRELDAAALGRTEKLGKKKLLAIGKRDEGLEPESVLRRLYVGRTLALSSLRRSRRTATDTGELSSMSVRGAVQWRVSRDPIARSCCM